LDTITVNGVASFLATVNVSDNQVLQFEGVATDLDAVIDKDLASSLLATQIKADEFYILTDVAKVCLNFNTPEEVQLDRITISKAKQYLEEKQFTEGSMAPKVRAAIQFVENGGKECIITEASELGKPNAGTRIVND